MNTTNSSAPKPDFLLIYTAPGKNPSYRRGVLDAVCYPQGHLVPYNYRRKNIDPNLLVDELRPLIGREAVIVFVDYDKQQGATYYPLRRVKIRKASAEKGKTEPPDPRERVKLFLQLGDYIEYGNSNNPAQWDATVKQFDSSRVIVQAKPNYFVITGIDKFTPSRHSTSLAWEELTKALASSKDFRLATFLKLSHLNGHKRTMFGLGPEQLIKKKYDGDRLIYLLRPGQICRLDLSVLESPNSTTTDGTNLEVMASAKDSLDVDQPHQSCVSGLTEKSVLVTCKRSIESITTTITVQAERKDGSQGTVNSPNPTLFVKIGVSLPVLILFVFLVFAGGLLVSTDTDFLKELWIRDWPVTITFFSRLLGAAMLAGAAFLAFRKLPSGQR